MHVHAVQHTVKWKGVPVAQSAAVELIVSDDRSLIVHSHRRIPPGNPWGAWLWVQREVLSTQRVECSVVMRPVGRGHLTRTYGKTTTPEFFSSASLFAIVETSFLVTSCLDEFDIRNSLCITSFSV